MTACRIVGGSVPEEKDSSNTFDNSGDTFFYRTHSETHQDQVTLHFALTLLRHLFLQLKKGF